MNLIDISWPLSPEMTAYKDRTVVEFTATKTYDQDGVRESVIRLGAHSGTHIDAPAHFLSAGTTVDQLALMTINGPCTVIDCTTVTDCITAQFLQTQSINRDDRILLKTRNSFLAHNNRFNSTFVYLDALAAAYLVQCGIQAVGIDYLGIERAQPGHETHSTLMHNGITIIEGLRLAHVNAGPYELICLPLAIVELEAAPARAVLRARP
jgi:arylformamidase